jgi:hypothetical protein
VAAEVQLRLFDVLAGGLKVKINPSGGVPFWGGVVHCLLLQLGCHSPQGDQVMLH